MSSQKKLFNSLLGALLILGIVVFGNVVASNLASRVDVTEESLYTLNEGTHNILDSLDAPVTLSFYWSKSLEGVPPQFKSFAKRVQELLDEYPSASKMISLEVVDPTPDSDEEEVAKRFGIQGAPLNSGSLYFGLVASGLDDENRQVIPGFDPQRERFLEYDITRSIYLASRGKKTKLGVLSSLKILGDSAPPPQFGAPPPQDQAKAWMFTEVLKRMYEIEELSASAESISPDIDLLLVFLAKDLSEKMQYAVDQFVLSGKQAIFFVDPLYMNEAQENPMMPPQADKSLDKIFDAWGIHYKSASIVGDPLTATQVRSPEGNVRHPTWLTLTTDNFSKEDVSTAQLSHMLMIYPGAVAKKDGVEDVEFTPLIKTSNRAKPLDRMQVRYGNALSLMKELQTGGSEQALAGLFVGNFKSAFAKAPEGVSGEHIAQAVEKAAVMVVADVDMLEDSYCLRPLSLFPGQIIGYQPLNQNTVFLSNAVEKMTGNKELISLRSRGQFVRPFTLVNEMKQEAQVKYQAQEERLEADLKDLEEKINNRIRNESGSEAIVTAAIQKELDQFRDKRAAIATELRMVRKNLRSEVDSLGTLVKWINIGVIPLLIALYGIFAAMQRSRRLRHEG